MQSRALQFTRSPALLFASKVRLDDLGVPLDFRGRAGGDRDAIVQNGDPLAATLAELARTYETRAQHWANALRAILGPLLLFILALGLGGLIVSVLALISSILRVFMSLTSF